LNRLHGIVGISMGLGILIADSLQANWKWTSVVYLLCLLLAFSSKIAQQEFFNNKRHLYYYKFQSQ
jgi:hypothetical protein